MNSAGLILGFVFGCVMSLLTFWHDVHRGELARKRPAHAPPAVPPLIHLIAAAITGFTAWQMTDAELGLKVGLVHLVVAYVVVRPLIER